MRGMQKAERAKSVCFTGHRSFPLSEVGRLLGAVQRLIERGYTDFYAGGADGFDARAAQCVVYLRARFPQIRLHLLLPCPKVQQTAGWDEAQKRLYDFIYQNADEIKVLTSGGRNCMRLRNKALVGAASCCLCWFDETRQRSGTAQTVRMAWRAGLVIENIWQNK